MFPALLEEGECLDNDPRRSWDLLGVGGVPLLVTWEGRGGVPGTVETAVVPNEIGQIK